MTRAERLAELQVMHDKVHQAMAQSYDNQLVKIQLRGVEDALDWVLGHCPHGELDASFDPVELAVGTEFKLGVVDAEGQELR